MVQTPECGHLPRQFAHLLSRSFQEACRGEEALMRDVFPQHEPAHLDLLVIFAAAVLLHVFDHVPVLRRRLQKLVRVLVRPNDQTAGTCPNWNRPRTTCTRWMAQRRVPGRSQPSSSNAIERESPHACGQLPRWASSSCLLCSRLDGVRRKCRDAAWRGATRTEGLWKSPCAGETSPVLAVAHPGESAVGSRVRSPERESNPRLPLYKSGALTS